MLFLRKVRSSDERKAGGSEITGEWKSRKALLSKRGTPADHTHTKDDRLAVTGVPLSCPWWRFHWCSEAHSVILGSFLSASFTSGQLTTRREEDDKARRGTATLLPLLSHAPALRLDGPPPPRAQPTRGLTLLLIFSHSLCLHCNVLSGSAQRPRDLCLCPLPLPLRVHRGSGFGWHGSCLPGRPLTLGRGQLAVGPSPWELLCQGSPAWWAVWKAPSLQENTLPQRTGNTLQLIRLLSFLEDIRMIWQFTFHLFPTLT